MQPSDLREADAYHLAPSRLLRSDLASSQRSRRVRRDQSEWRGDHVVTRIGTDADPNPMTSRRDTEPPSVLPCSRKGRTPALTGYSGIGRHRTPGATTSPCQTLTLGALLLVPCPIQPTTYAPVTAQQTIDPQQLSGTLDLAIANRNGVVIVTDSRVTGGPHVDDNYQKLFRTGEKSAAAITGTVGVGGLPLTYEVAALIRGEPEFQWWPGRALDQPHDVYAGLNVRLEVLLQRVAAVNSLYRWPIPTIVVAAVVAGIESDGTRYIRRVDLVRRSYVHAGWGTFPRIEASPREAKTASFDWERAGPLAIEEFVDRVLDGTDVPTGDIFQRYARARAEAREDTMAIEDLKKLALSIMELAKQMSPVIGGPTQAGVFPVVGQVEWLQQKFELQESAMIARSSFSIGEVRDGRGRRPQRQPALLDEFDDFNEPLTYHSRDTTSAAISGTSTSCWTRPPSTGTASVTSDLFTGVAPFAQG